MIAFKTYNQSPEELIPESIVDLLSPWMECEVNDEDHAKSLINSGWEIMDRETYDLYKKIHSPIEFVIDAIEADKKFGEQIINEFSAENVFLGVTELGMTGTILERLESVLDAVSAGSLLEAITRCKLIDVSNYDEIFITKERILNFINKIENHMGLPQTMDF